MYLALIGQASRRALCASCSMKPLCFNMPLAFQIYAPNMRGLGKISHFISHKFTLGITLSYVVNYVKQ